MTSTSPSKLTVCSRHKDEERVEFRNYVVALRINCEGVATTYNLWLGNRFRSYGKKLNIAQVKIGAACCCWEAEARAHKIQRPSLSKTEENI